MIKLRDFPGENYAIYAFEGKCHLRERILFNLFHTNVSYQAKMQLFKS